MAKPAAQPKRRNKFKARKYSKVSLRPGRKHEIKKIGACGAAASLNMLAKLENKTKDNVFSIAILACIPQVDHRLIILLSSRKNKLNPFFIQ